MGTCPWIFLLVTVALLLDPTFGDVLVQPGYGQPKKAAKDSVAQSQSMGNQPTAKSQQSYFPQQNPTIQLLQQRHALEHQYLQHQHQQEHNQLLQLQQMELQNPAIHQYQSGGQDIVGSPWGLPLLSAATPFGTLAGSKLFSLGPLGLNTFRLGGGGLGFPLLLSPHQQGQMQGSTQFQKSMDGPSQPRARRDVRDSGDSSGKKYRQKITRVQQAGLAENPSVKSKLDSTSQNGQTSKTNDQIVGDANNNNDPTVGSSLLDPLGLMDKTEELIDDLKSGHLPNPLNAFTHGGLLPNWLNKAATPAETHQVEEHVVGQSQYQYPTQGTTNMMNQQLPQSQQQQIVGAARHGPLPYHPFGPPPPPPLYGPPGPFGPGPFGPGPGAYGPPPYPYRPPHVLFRSAPQPYFMNMQRSGMSYGANPITGTNNPSSLRQPSVQTNWGNPLTGSTNPSVQNPVVKNAAMSKPQMMTEKTSGSGQASSTMNDQIVGAPNPQAALGSSGGYDQIVGAPNPTDSLYQLAKIVQPMMGQLLDPMTGSAQPTAWNGGATPYNNQPGGRNTMVGNPMTNALYDQSGRMNYYGYNGGPERHAPFGMDDVYDDHFHHMHRGGFDRIYESLIDDGPFSRPHYVHSHEGYIL